MANVKKSGGCMAGHSHLCPKCGREAMIYINKKKHIKHRCSRGHEW